MNLLPFGELAPYQPRHFLPATIDLGTWEEIEPLFDRLASRLEACTDVPALEQWLLDWGELSAALDQESSCRYIAMTCHTENPEAEKRYLEYVEKIDPRLKPRQFALCQALLRHPCVNQLPNSRYEVLIRDVRVSVELFREENVPLETEDTKLGQQYQKLTGSLTVQFRGEEKTLVQMGPYMEEPDRSLREEAWKLTAKRRQEVAESMEAIYEKLLPIRGSIASNAGFENYRDYAFRSKCRFDYTPQDCLDFHDAIESEVMPLLRELESQRKTQLGLETLRPWDLGVDPFNRPPLKPFETVDQLMDRTQQTFDRVDGELAASFKGMREKHLLDLGNRKGKAPGGYQSSLGEARLPFIFMNAVGLQKDVETLLHESGHAFHALAVQEEPLYGYRHAPIEFCEVASMAMELLGNEHLDAFYTTDEARRARIDHLEGIIKFFPWMATIDAFQHWIYTNKDHNRADRTSAWLGLMNRFGAAVDWSGFEAVREIMWHRQLHLFLCPFYYVEYGIAQLGALQVWANAIQDRPKAITDYRRALALGGSQPLPRLFEAAGCKFDFSAATLKPLMALIQRTLAELRQ